MYKSNTHKAIAQTKKNKTMRKKKIRGGLGSKELIVLIFVFLYITSLNVSALGPGMFTPTRSVRMEDNWLDSHHAIVTNDKNIIKLATTLGLQQTADFFAETKIYLKGIHELKLPLTELQARAAKELMQKLWKELDSKAERDRLTQYMRLSLPA